MNRGGVGSASIVLIFAVLCLTIFTVVSLLSALTEESLIDAEVHLVEAFYEADTLAELILAEVLSAEIVPEAVRGVEIYADWDWDLMAEVISFTAPVSDTKELYVIVAIGFDYYEILSWRMYNIGEWEADDRLNVWTGSFDNSPIINW